MAIRPHPATQPSPVQYGKPSPCLDPETTKPDDFGKPTVTVPADLAMGGKGVLLVKSFYLDSYRLPEAFRAAGATVAEWWSVVQMTRNLLASFARITLR